MLVSILLYYSLLFIYFYNATPTTNLRVGMSLLHLRTSEQQLCAEQNLYHLVHLEHKQLFHLV